MRHPCGNFLSAFALLALTACGSAPKTPEDKTATQPVATTSGPAAAPVAKTSATAQDSKTVAKPGVADTASTAPAEPAPLPPEGVQRFDRAVAMMASNAAQAEQEFKALSAAYPQYSGAQVNLGILQARAGRLADAEQSLKTATQRNSANAVAFNELGIVYRRLGRFKEAEEAYSQAIKVDPGYANAYLNLGVLCDLYLQDPARALEAYEHYLQVVTKPQPQVEGWVKELKSRVGAAGAADRSASADQ